MNDGNGTIGNGQPTPLGNLANAELVKLYDQYDADGEEFAQVKEEMLRRGYSFEAPQQSANSNQPAQEIYTQP